MWFGRNRNRGFLFLFFACHCVPWFAVTIKVVAEDFFFFPLWEMFIYKHHHLVLYKMIKKNKKNRGVGVLSEYGGSYSVVCVINIPAQTAQTAACTSVWLFSVTRVLTLLWHCWHMPPPPNGKGVNLLFLSTLCFCETIAIKCCEFCCCFFYQLLIWCDSQAVPTVRFFDFRHIFTPIFSHADWADEKE